MSKLYKLVKITRLMRVFKLMKSNSKTHLKKVGAKLKIGAGVEKLIFFFLILMLMCHFVCCIWIFTAKQFHDHEDDEDPFELSTNWIDAGDFGDLSVGQLYITSFYFSVTTITTVGYGDINGNSTVEYWICFFLHLIGVLSYSFAAGSLTTII